MFWFDRLLVRLFKGIYCYDYIQVYKEYNKRSPFKPCYEDDVVIHFIKFFENRDNLPVLKTKQSIKFASSEFFIKYKNLLRQKGKPDFYSVTKEQGVEIKSFGYLTEFFSTKTKENYYFVDNEFFMGEYYFSDARKLDSDKLFSSLMEKYGVSSGNDNLKEGKFFIKDSNGAVLHAEHTGFAIAIRYFNQNASVKGKLDTFLESGRLKAKSRFSGYIAEEDFNRL